MKWVTGRRPRIDGVACPWLIWRFIEPAAEILYVPADRVLAVARDTPGGGLSFDAPGARYDHLGGCCPFEVLVNEFDLAGDRALGRLARIVHAAGSGDNVGSDPAGVGLLAIGVGGLEVEEDDYRLVKRTGFVFDALYAWCTRQAAAVPA